MVSVQQGPRLSLTGISGAYNVKLYLEQKEQAATWETEPAHRGFVWCF